MSETVLPVHPTLLHPTSGEPLQAIGHRRNGDPIWPVIGGAEDDDNDTGDGDGTDDGTGDDGDPNALGDAGKKALEAEKDRRRKALEAKRTAEAALEAARAEIATLKAGQSGEGDDEAKRKAAIDAAVKTATDEATRNANRRILQADIRSAATGKLAKPADALLFIDLDKLDVGADGSVDESDIAEAIEDLLKDRPYLAAQGGTRTPTAAEVDAGPRGDGGGKPKPRQVTEAELKTMPPEAIVKARDEGRLADLLGG